MSPLDNLPRIAMMKRGRELGQIWRSSTRHNLNQPPRPCRLASSDLAVSGFRRVGYRDSTAQSHVRRIIRDDNQSGRRDSIPFFRKWTHVQKTATSLSETG